MHYPVFEQITKSIDKNQTQTCTTLCFNKSHKSMSSEINLDKNNHHLFNNINCIIAKGSNLTT